MTLAQAFTAHGEIEQKSAFAVALLTTELGAGAPPELIADAMEYLADDSNRREEKRKFSKGERDDAADEGDALPDGSFPIKNRDDLKNAISAYGRAKDKDAAKRHIMKRARELGAAWMLPEDWTSEGKARSRRGFSRAAATADRLFSAAWDPNAHPRDENGRFLDTPDVQLSNGAHGRAIRQVGDSMAVQLDSGTMVNVNARDVRGPGPAKPDTPDAPNAPDTPDAKSTAITGVSDEFTGTSGFAAARVKVRDDIIEAHGGERGARGYNLRVGSMVLDKNVNGKWVAYSDGAPSDMLDAVRSDPNGRFRFRSANVPIEDANAGPQKPDTPGSPRTGRPEVGERVSTEFGPGEVTDSSDRRVAIKLDNGDTINVVTGTPGYDRIKRDNPPKADVPDGAAPATPAAKKPKARKGDHFVTLPDGTVEKRNSKTRTYTHAVVYEQDNAKAAQSLREQAAAQRAKGEDLRKKADTGKITETRRPWGGGAEYVDVYVGGEYVAGGPIGSNLPDFERPTDDELRAKLRGYADGRDREAERLDAKADRLDAGPDKSYSVLRWSGSEQNARSGSRSKEFAHLAETGRLYVTPVDPPEDGAPGPDRTPDRGATKPEPDLPKLPESDAANDTPEQARARKLFADNNPSDAVITGITEDTGDLDGRELPEGAKLYKATINRVRGDKKGIDSQEQWIALNENGNPVGSVTTPQAQRRFIVEGLPEKTDTPQGEDLTKMTLDDIAKAAAEAFMNGDMDRVMALKEEVDRRKREDRNATPTPSNPDEPTDPTTLGNEQLQSEIERFRAMKERDGKLSENNQQALDAMEAEAAARREAGAMPPEGAAPTPTPDPTPTPTPTPSTDAWDVTTMTEADARRRLEAQGYDAAEVDAIVEDFRRDKEAIDIAPDGTLDRLTIKPDRLKEGDEVILDDGTLDTVSSVNRLDDGRVEVTFEGMGPNDPPETYQSRQNIDVAWDATKSRDPRVAALREGGTTPDTPSGDLPERMKDPESRGWSLTRNDDGTIRMERDGVTATFNPQDGIVTADTEAVDASDLREGDYLIDTNLGPVKVTGPGKFDEQGGFYDVPTESGNRRFGSGGPARPGIPAGPASGAAAAPARSRPPRGPGSGGRTERIIPADRGSGDAATPELPDPHEARPLTGKDVRVDLTRSPNPVYGTLEGVTDDGSLQIRTAEGTLLTLAPDRVKGVAEGKAPADRGAPHPVGSRVSVMGTVYSRDDTGVTSTRERVDGTVVRATAVDGSGGLYDISVRTDDGEIVVVRASNRSRGGKDGVQEPAMVTPPPPGDPLPEGSKVNVKLSGYPGDQPVEATLNGYDENGLARVQFARGEEQLVPAHLVTAAPTAPEPTPAPTPDPAPRLTTRPDGLQPGDVVLLGSDRSIRRTVESVGPSAEGNPDLRDIKFVEESDPIPFGVDAELNYERPTPPPSGNTGTPTRGVRRESRPRALRDDGKGDGAKAQAEIPTVEQIMEQQGLDEEAAKKEWRRQYNAARFRIRRARLKAEAEQAKNETIAPDERVRRTSIDSLSRFRSESVNAALGDLERANAIESFDDARANLLNVSDDVRNPAASGRLADAVIADAKDLVDQYVAGFAMPIPDLIANLRRSKETDDLSHLTPEQRAQHLARVDGNIALLEGNPEGLRPFLDQIERNANMRAFDSFAAGVLDAKVVPELGDTNEADAIQRIAAAAAAAKDERAHTDIKVLTNSLVSGGLPAYIQGLSDVRPDDRPALPVHRAKFLDLPDDAPLEDKIDRLRGTLGKGMETFRRKEWDNVHQRNTWVKDRAKDNGPTQDHLDAIDTLKTMGELIDRDADAIFQQRAKEAGLDLDTLDADKEKATARLAELEVEIAAANKAVPRGGNAQQSFVTGKRVEYIEEHWGDENGYARREPGPYSLSPAYGAFTKELSRLTLAQRSGELSADDEAKLTKLRDLNTAAERYGFGELTKAINGYNDLVVERRTLMAHGGMDPEKKKKLAKVRSDAYRETLARVTSIGETDSVKMRFLGGAAAPRKALDWATGFYPTSWIENAARIPVTVKRGTRRGHYESNRSAITLSKSEPTIDGDNGLFGVAIHELGHHMEKMVPGLADAEWAFLWQRTSTGDPDNRTRESQSAIYRTEYGYKDDFKGHYSGKTYGFGLTGDNEHNYELFTTGVQDLFAGEGDYLDDDFRRWLLGVMAHL
ncbi:hypothetical protein [Phycicoccus sp.]|uniref:hypothetical protein n=1 Tax=Phycicoccus sp. TaxID=1902410 RepID=UPI002B726E09|nr:hypothetical protein [Phycicoccus sp.]HMM95387.1 hypothetical protein [Phycicoccus sp.]